MSLERLGPMVALDLEATGTDPVRDEVIEVAAVRFQGPRVLATYTTLVNPYRPLPPEVQRLTGIRPRDLEGAPPMAVVAGELLDFVGDAPLVGQSVDHDRAFLERRGVVFPGPSYDTYDLAYLALPRADYSLAGLARLLGVEHPPSHRALDDALATHQVFLALVGRLLALGAGVVGELARLADLAGWPLRHLFRSLEGLVAGGREAYLGGVDPEALRRRLQVRARGRPSRPPSTPPDPEETAGLLAPDGAVARALPGYEHRPQQVEMARRVARALASRSHLLVEAGTGIGKSLAYLIPLLRFALHTGERVVVSTNTINLQEQLVGRDIPLALEALARVEGEEARGLRFAVLKGRGNYLCLRRWGRWRSSPALSPEEARLLGKVVVWLQGTAAGDRAELALPGRDALMWDRLSAAASRECPPPQGPCFLRTARDRAESASLVVVNHALLLSDLARGGGLLPEHDYLVVDEAHHLEEEATRQFGFRVTQDGLEDLLGALVGPRGLTGEVASALRLAGAGLSPARAEGLAGVLEGLEGSASGARRALSRLFEAGLRLLEAEAPSAEGRQLRLTPSVRSLKAWNLFRGEWENASLSLREVARQGERLALSLEGLGGSGPPDWESLRSETTSRLADLEEVVGDLARFFGPPSDDFVYWLEVSERGAISLNGAPLEVGPLLRERLFSRRASVVLTSATLTVAGSFRHIRERLGLEEAEELRLDSPFDFRRLVLVCVPEDIPEPDSPHYAGAAAQVVADLARSAGGRTMALFTSHSALRAVRPRVLSLEREGLRVLVQGFDGTPAQLVERFQREPRSLLLGTSSLWEGVDLAGELLQVLVLARLPFPVPTDPLYSARAERYENPFLHYAIPQAVLRFRQGFGRLVRGEEDRGVVVVLDRRLLSRSYGGAFLRSLPPCRVVKVGMRHLHAVVARWLAGEGLGG